jgi:hypothetical protein
MLPMVSSGLLSHCTNPFEIFSRVLILLVCHVYSASLYYYQLTESQVQWTKLRDDLMPVFDNKHQVWQMSKAFKELRKFYKLRFTVMHQSKQTSEWHYDCIS